MNAFNPSFVLWHHTDLARIHDFKYDYSRVEKNQTGDIEVICRNHGIFTTTMIKHRHGAGCPECEIIEERNKLDEGFAQLVKQYNEKYNYKYIYVNSIFHSMGRKISIECPEHGIFTQTPKQHLERTGCKQCLSNKTAKQQTTVQTSISATEAQRLVLLDAFIEVYGERYNYDLFVFKGLNKRFIAQCKSHGAFRTTPLMHIRGDHCPDCRKAK